MLVATLKGKLNTGTNEALCDWNSAVPLHNCFENATGSWNTRGRTVTGTSSPYRKPGFAAEGEDMRFSCR